MNGVDQASCDLLYCINTFLPCQTSRWVSGVHESLIVWSVKTTICCQTQYNTDQVRSVVGAILQNMFEYAHLVREYSMIQKNIRWSSAYLCERPVPFAMELFCLIVRVLTGFILTSIGQRTQPVYISVAPNRQWIANQNKQSVSHALCEGWTIMLTTLAKLTYQIIIALCRNQYMSPNRYIGLSVLSEFQSVQDMQL